MKPLRIALTYHKSLATPGGGAEVVLHVAHQLHLMGCAVTLLPVHRDHEKAAPDTPCRVIPVRPSRLHYLLDGWNVRRTVSDLMRSEGVDAVISRATEGAFLPALLRRAGVPHAMFGGVPSYAEWINRHARWSPKRVADAWFFLRPLRRARWVFADSEFTRGELTQIVGCDADSVRVTYLGVDEEFLAPAREAGRDVSRFIYCGSLARYKGVFDAIEALGIVARRRSAPWLLRIAGWGDWEAVRAAVRAHKIEDRVEMLGFLDRREQVRQLMWAHVAVLPSHSESFGLAVAEAQASGLPVAAYAAGSIPEVAEHGVTALLCTTGRTDELADAIERFMDDPALVDRMARAARDRVRTRFSWRGTATRIREALETSLAGRAR